MALLMLFLTLVFFHSLVSNRLERSILTAPIIFTCAGAVAVLVRRGATEGQTDTNVLLHVAEVGLVLLLFTDASRSDLQLLKKGGNLPARLLSLGMLLSLVLGGVFALALFGHLTIWEAGILAAILAPTDAGLGQIIVKSERVPRLVREALNVEAGLNDGLSVPFLLFFIALAKSGAGGGEASLTRFIVEQLGYGVMVGASLGLPGGWLLGLADRHRSMSESWQQLGVVAIPLMCLVMAEAIGASMFIAAFVAGLAVQVGFRDVSKHSVAFTEEWGQIVNLSIFFLLGMLAERAWNHVGWRHLVYAALSLTVVRMVPVAMALWGSRFHRATVLFIGWFGPRGLASIVLGLVYLEHEVHEAGDSTVRLAVVVTVLLSIFAHGLSAKPGINLYARRIQSLPPGAPEFQGETDAA